jgi:tol-pal system protein YbgF
MFRPFSPRHFASAALCALLLATSSVAQAQYYQSNDPDSETSPASLGNAALDVRISQLEEQMRALRGTVEQLSNQNTQLKAQLDKMTADTQYRLNALEQKSSGAPAGAAPAAGNPSDQLQPTQNPSEDNGADAGASSSQQFASPRDHYNYAYKLLIQAKYPEAGASFADFTRQYPHDPLIGNGFYWLGETYYVRRDYVKAADSFRQGYEAMPSGPKAADNLLKLAMSLNAMDKNKEACIVLKQISTKFSSSSTASRADQESNRIGCE